MSQITYADKVALSPQPDVADINKVTDGDMNMIKNAHNDTDNKLTNLNTYNTTEQIVGTWTDGKPIYRKVIKYTTQSQEYDISSLNLDTLVRFDYYQEIFISITNNYYKRGTFYGNENDYFFMFIRNNTIQARDSADANSFIAYNIILEYTKTTD